MTSKPQNSQHCFSSAANWRKSAAFSAVSGSVSSTPYGVRSIDSRLMRSRSMSVMWSGSSAAWTVQAIGFVASYRGLVELDT